MSKKFEKNDLATYSSKATHFFNHQREMYDWYDEVLSQDYFLIIDEDPERSAPGVVEVYNGSEVKRMFEEDLEKVGE